MPRNAMTRSTRYVLLNSVIGGWLVAAIVAVGVHRFVPQPIWLMVHVTLLGAASSAILIWSQHFSDALLRRKADPNERSLPLRLAVHTVGAILAVTGMMMNTWLFVLIGGAIVGLNALVHGATLWRQLHGALPARFAPLVRYYIAGSLCLAGGVVLGIYLAGSVSATEHSRLLAGHLALNFFGWIGLTVVGTIVLLWPTVLRTRVGDGVGPAAVRFLPVFLTGIALMLLAAAINVPLLLVPGIIVWLGALAPQIIFAVQEARQQFPSSYAVWSLAAGLLWLIGSSIGIIVAILREPDWLSITTAVFSALIPWVVGFMVQVLLGALSELLPVAISRSPRGRKEAARVLNQGAAFRIIVINGGLLLYLLPLPSLVKVMLSGVVFAALAWFVVLAVVAIRAARRPAVAGMTEPTDPAAPGAPTQPAGNLGKITAALAVLSLAIAGGIALDPAAAGIGTFTGPQSGTVAETGETTQITVTVEGMRFVPGIIEVPAGNRLVITFENTGDDSHDLTLASGLSTPRLSPGETAVLDAGVISASLDAWCSVAGHRQMGMVLSIVATGAAAVSDEQASGEHNMAGMGGSNGALAIGAAADIDLQKTPSADFSPWDPRLSPVTAATTHEVTLRVSEQEREVSPGVSQTLWSFGGSIPGPALRGKVGDTFVITLENDGSLGHSIDFHAGALAPDLPMRTIQPGESLTYTFTATRAGIWMYHCSTMPMSLHIANGMFGAVIIDPPGLLPVDQEYLLVQSELYLGEQGDIASMAKITAEKPDLVVFNGYANQYNHFPLTAKVGERVRVWVLDAGPNRPTSFHVIGGQFDTVFAEGDYTLKDGGSTGVGGAQTLGLQAAQGGFVELTFPEVGNYPFVNHVMVDAERGASGIFRISE